MMQALERTGALGENITVRGLALEDWQALYNHWPTGSVMWNRLRGGILALPLDDPGVDGDLVAGTGSLRWMRHRLLYRALFVDGRAVGSAKGVVA